MANIPDLVQEINALEAELVNPAMTPEEGDRLWAQIDARLDQLRVLREREAAAAVLAEPAPVVRVIPVVPVVPTPPVAPVANVTQVAPANVEAVTQAEGGPVATGSGQKRQSPSSTTVTQPQSPCGPTSNAWAAMAIYRCRTPMGQLP